MRILCFKIFLIVGIGLNSVFSQTEEMARRAQEASEAMSSGDYLRAASIYEELAQALPDISGLKMNVGMAYYMAGEFERALPHLSSAVTGDPSLMQAWLFLGSTQLELGRHDEAATSLKTYLGKSPQDAGAQQMLGDALLAGNKADEAEHAFRKAVELEPKNPRSWFRLGTTYETMAAESFQQLEQVAPESGYWFALIAASRVAQNQNSSALFFYRKALEKTPNLRGIHFAISQIYQQTEHPEWAEQERQKEAALGTPDCDKEAYVCLFLEGSFLKLLKAASSTETPASLYWRVQACNQLAVATFARLLELPPSFEVHQLRAEIHTRQGRFWEAVNEWKKALELDPQNRVVKRELALSLYFNRDYDGSRVLVDELLKSEPDSGQLNFLAGDILLYQQKAEAAIPFLEKAVKFTPESIGAQSSLGRAYMHVGASEKAIPHLLKALPSDEDGSLHFQLARAYQRTGQREKAKQFMTKYQEVTKFIREEEARLDEEMEIGPP
jgi:tetratricopeptide (TPR) repeat protein